MPRAVGTLCILACVMCAVGCEGRYVTGVSQIIEDDIYVNNEAQIKLKTAYSTSEHNPWPNNRIPFSVHDAIRNDKLTYTNVKAAMLAIQDKTNDCVRFTQRWNDTLDYINITRNGPGCYSSVGRVGGEQTVNIGVGCESVGVIMHELLHALGFWHEQSRSDRDSYVVIKYENIIYGRDVEFSKRTGQNDLEQSVPYDFHSILHYKHNQFAKLKTLDTIVPTAEYSKQVDKTELGQRVQLSEKDVSKINWLYKCGQYSIARCSSPRLDQGVVNPVQTQYNPGSIVKFTCTSGYLVGPADSTCQHDGTWSGTEPFCIQAAQHHYTYCDMESECYYRIPLSTGVSWKQHQGPTDTQNTGPMTDHTLNRASGRYLLLEATGLSPGQYALILMNTVYKRYGDNVCIMFYYHMYGDAMGTLTVYANWSPVFHRTGSASNTWTRAFVQNIHTWYPYIMVMIHGTRGSGETSDIAVDDVLIGPCAELTRYNDILKAAET